MVITTEMMQIKKAVTYQTDIMDSLGGSLNTSDLAAATAAALAGLDLIWLVKKFGADPDLAQELADARDAAEAVVEDAKQVVISAYQSAKTTYDGIMLALTGTTDPANTLQSGIAIAKSQLEESKAAAEAAVFVTMFTGQ